MRWSPGALIPPPAAGQREHPTDAGPAAMARGRRHHLQRFINDGRDRSQNRLAGTRASQLTQLNSPSLCPFDPRIVPSPATVSSTGENTAGRPGTASFRVLLGPDRTDVVGRELQAVGGHSPNPRLGVVQSAATGGSGVSISASDRHKGSCKGCNVANRFNMMVVEASRPGEGFAPPRASGGTEAGIPGIRFVKGGDL